MISGMAMSPLLTSTFKLIVLPALSAVSRAPPRPPLLALSARLAELRGGVSCRQMLGVNLRLWKVSGAF